MRNAWSSRIGMVTLVGVMVVSAGLVLPSNRALAERDDKDHGSAIDLRGVTQNWDKNLPSASRFTVLSNFGGVAVRDNETGLVWEQAPDASVISWALAARECADKIVGGRKGWRLPSVVELSSLLDPSLPIPFVPASIFTGVQSADYWSATIDAGQSPPVAWRVFFSSGLVTIAGSTDSGRAWCVRGPMNASVY